MNKSVSIVLAGVVGVMAFEMNLKADVLINEIMYYPKSGNIAEQWFEIYNQGSETVDLSSWRVSDGIEYTFPTGTLLEGGAYLVVAADPTQFAAVYPEVQNVIGGWGGKLSKKGERICLSDAQGNEITEVSYASEGDWGVRKLFYDPHSGLSGWEWYAPHNGEGCSLELVNPLRPITIGQNWEASENPGGTPGAVNSRFRSGMDQAPLISEPTHSPVIPTEGEQVRVSVRITAEPGSSPSGALLWRVSAEEEFTQTLLKDDGDREKSGDLIAGDGVYTALLPGQTVGTVTEFYFTAWMEENLENVRQYPQIEEAEGRSARLVYQVDEEAYSGNQPMLRLVLSPQEYNYLNNNLWPSVVISEMMANGSLICQSAGGEMPECFYQCGFRNRGKGTAALVPHNIHLAIPKDRDWEGRTSFNANTKDTHCQVISSVISRLAGVPMAESRPVQLRVNAENLANAIAPQFGSYAGNEAMNGDLASRQYPLDSDGNLYRGKRFIYSWDMGSADLLWRGDQWQSYTNAYTKENNSMENDWSDLIGLLDVLNNSSDEEYTQAVESVVNVEEWMRYFAVNTLLANQETSLATGVGDDFAMYCGKKDPRFELIVYDMDSVMGLGERTEIYGQGLWQMCSLPTVKRFMEHNSYAPLYFRALKELGEGLFSPEQMNPILDNVLGDWVSASALENMKQFNSNHVSYILSLIPGEFALTNTFNIQNGYPTVTEPQVTLGGTTDAAQTSRVTVNGVEADYTAWQGNWKIELNLNPGLNFLILRVYNLEGEEILYQEQYLYYDRGEYSELNLTAIEEDMTLTAADGPWIIRSSLMITNGATLFIEPGTSVMMDERVYLRIAKTSRIHAQGTESKPIVLSGVPGKERWGGIALNHTGVINVEGQPENYFQYVHGRDNDTFFINANYGVFYLDHLTFGTTDRQYLNLNWCSFMMSHCRFPESTGDIQLVRAGGGTLMDGRAILYRNYFGKTYGHNDPADLTDGNWETAGKFHIIENVFMGSGDDLLDLDGTDAWVEGNILMHAHQNNSWGGASAISGGRDEGRTAEHYIVGNLFYDNDYDIKAKDGNFHVAVHNTFVRVTNEGGEDTTCGLLGCYDEGYPEARGFYLEDNIICQIKEFLWGYTNAVITLKDNLIEEPWCSELSWLRGGGNSASAPLFNSLPELSETTQFQTWEQAQVMKEWFAVRNDSPAIGSGFNGRDKGFTVKRGVSISGEPEGVTGSRNAVLNFGALYTDFGTEVPDLPRGAGYTAYRWRLNCDGKFGEWSQETPIQTPLELNELEDGVYFVQVSGLRHNGMWDDDERMGEAMYLACSKTWEVRSDLPVEEEMEPLQLSELNFDLGEIEIWNAGKETIDLTDWSLTDLTDLPGRVTFAQGILLEPGMYLSVSTGMDLPLDRKGGVVYLMKDTRVIDSVSWGAQPEGYSLSRMNVDSWILSKPTPGAMNLAVETGESSELRINEWLAREQSAGEGRDFIEIYNPGTLPVRLGGMYLTDAVRSPERFRIPENIFISSGGYMVFVASGNENLGYNHLNFKLNSDSGVIGLYDSELNCIDLVVYHSQQSDVSQGRIPDGDEKIDFCSIPTPGAPNPAPDFEEVFVTETEMLISMTNRWDFDQSGTNLGTSWREPDYDITGWESGLALFYNEYDPLPAPKNTPLTLGPTTMYFRTSFMVSEDEFESWTDPSQGWICKMNTVLDDGVVFYLNGVEIYRVNMPEGNVNFNTWAISHESRLQGPFILSLDALIPGENILAAELHQDKPNSSDAVFGAEVWMEHSVLTRVPLQDKPRLSEILVSAVDYQLKGASSWIELYNPTETEISLDGMSLSDDVSEPRLWSFPLGVVIPPGAYLAVPCSANEELFAEGELYIPFELNSRGGSLLLYDAESQGGSLIDSVAYGFQVEDYSLARMDLTQDEWSLASPTPGESNLMAEMGSIRTDPVFINEWMASPSAGADWFELYCGGSLPIALGGYYLTDDLNEPSKFRLAPYSYLGGKSRWIQVMADDKVSADTAHVNFKLSGSGELIALFTPLGGEVDLVEFGLQTEGVSQGRYPDGAELISDFVYPTPGNRNALESSEMDSDGDGMDDEWEVLYGFDPLDPTDAALDSDGDGISNLDEYWAGTDPLNPDDFLKILKVELVPAAEEEENPELSLTLSLRKGRSYGLEVCKEGEWSLCRELSTGTEEGEVTITEPVSFEKKTLYRIKAMKVN